MILETPEKKEKRDERIIRAIEGLTSQIEGAADPKRATKSGFFEAALSGGIGAIRGNISQALDPANLLEGVAASRGGIMGAILGAGAEHIRGKRAEKNKKEKWASGYLAGTERGRELMKEHGSARAAELAAGIYDQKEELGKRTTAIEEKRNLMKASGVEGADISEEDSNELAALKQQITELTSGLKKETRKTDASNPIVSGNEGVLKKTAIAADGQEELNEEELNEEELNEEELKKVEELRAKKLEGDGPSKADIGDFLYKRAVSGGIGDYGPGDDQQEEFLQDVRQGIDEELLDIGQEQLEMLKKLVAAATESEEDKLERKLPQEQGDSPAVKNGDDEKKKPASFLDGIVSKIGDLFESGIGKLLKGIPGGGILGAGTGAVKGILGAGTGAVKGILGAGTGVVKGAATVGAGAIKGLGSLALGAGKMVAPYALPALGVAAAGAAGYGAGKLLNNYALDPLAEKITGTEGATVGTALYDSVDKVKGALGFENDATKEKEAMEAAKVALGKRKLEVGEKISPTIAESLKAAGVAVPASSISTPVAPKPVAPEPQRAQQAAIIAQKEAAVLEAKETKKAAKETPAQPNSIQQNIVNSNKTVTNVRPDMRTNEPTFLRYSSQVFSF